MYTNDFNKLGGFRFHVFAPIDIDEQRTLIYGPSLSQGIYVNCSKEKDMDDSIPLLADLLNLNFYPKKLPTSVERLCIAEQRHIVQRINNIISKDFQIHQCADRKMYAVSLVTIDNRSNGLYESSL